MKVEALDSFLRDEHHHVGALRARITARNQTYIRLIRKAALETSISLVAQVFKMAPGAVASFTAIKPEHLDTVAASSPLLLGVRPDLAQADVQRMLSQKYEPSLPLALASHPLKGLLLKAHLEAATDYLLFLWSSIDHWDHKEAGVRIANTSLNAPAPVANAFAALDYAQLLGGSALAEEVKFFPPERMFQNHLDLIVNGQPHLATSLSLCIGSVASYSMHAAV